MPLHSPHVATLQFFFFFLGVISSLLLSNPKGKCMYCQECGHFGKISVGGLFMEEGVSGGGGGCSSRWSESPVYEQ